MSDTPSNEPPGPSVNVDVRIQPGPDGTPWEAMNITFGIVGFTIVMPPGRLAELAERIPSAVKQAREKAIDADNAEIARKLSVIPANAMDQLPNFEAARNLNRAQRRHPGAPR